MDSWTSEEIRRKYKLDYSDIIKLEAAAKSAGVPLDKLDYSKIMKNGKLDNSTLMLIASGAYLTANYLNDAKKKEKDAAEKRRSHGDEIPHKKAKMTQKAARMPTQSRKAISSRSEKRESRISKSASEPDGEGWAEPDSQPDNRKSWKIALCLSILFGAYGLDRFYLGYKKIGLLKFCTIGGIGLLWAYDAYCIATKSGFASKIGWR